MIDCNQFEGTSPLLDEKLQGELKGIFGKMETAVTLKAVVDMEEEKSREMALFLKTAASLSNLLTLELYTPLEAEALEFDTEYLPATGLYKDGVYSGVSFHGVPGGREINSFVLAIYNLSGPGQEIGRGLVKKIQKIKTGEYQSVRFPGLSPLSGGSGRQSADCHSESAGGGPDAGRKPVSGTGGAVWDYPCAFRDSQ